MKKLLLFMISITLIVSTYTQTTTFNANGTGNSGSIQQYVVPNCVTSVEIEGFGAQGGNTNGGKGARMKGTFNVTFGDTLFIVVGQQGTVNTCGGDSVQLSAGGASVYNWAPSAGLSNTTGMQVISSPSSSMLYTVTGTDTNGCSDTTMVSVTINQPPSLSISGNNSICIGDTTVLTASGASSYIWSPSSGLSNTSAPTVIVAASINTTYTITGIGANGCKDSIHVNILLNAAPVADAGLDDTICAGENIILNGSGGQTYLWDNKFTTASINVSPLSNTTYTLIASNGGCHDSDFVNVFVYPIPTTSAFGSNTIVFGTSTALSVTGNGTYNWYPGQGLSCNTCANPVASPPQTTTYYVSVIDSNGCVGKDSVVIIVDLLCGNIFIPNAFSPNNDGQNDIFYIKANCISYFLFQIYNRWGEKIFETTDISQGWDGFYKGKLLDTDVFAFSLQANLNNGQEIVKKGNISLIR